MTTASQTERSRRGRNSRRIGGDKERAAVKWFRAQGYVAIHNTHGPFDVMAALPGDLILAEVKYGPRPYGNYPPRERAETIAAALQAGARAALCWWKPRASEPQLIFSEDWPGA